MSEELLGHVMLSFSFTVSDKATKALKSLPKESQSP